MRHFLRNTLQQIGWYPPHTETFGMTRKIPWPWEFFSRTISFAQQGEDLCVNRIFKRRLGIDAARHAGFYLDIGAYHPVSHSTTYLFYCLGWRGICVDISRDSCQLLSKIRPRDSVFHCAIGASDCMGSAHDATQISLVNNVRPVQPHTVTARDVIDMRSATSLLDEVGLTTALDYLNIDVEGEELSAIEGLDFNKWSPKVISVEIHSTCAKTALTTPVATALYERNYICVAAIAITFIFIKRQEHK